MRQAIFLSAIAFGIGDVVLFAGDHLWQIGRGALAQLDWLRLQAEHYTHLPT